MISPSAKTKSNNHPKAGLQNRKDPQETKENSEVRIGISRPQICYELYQQEFGEVSILSRGFYSVTSKVVRIGSLLIGFELDIHFGSDRQLSEFFQDMDLLISEASSLLIDSLVFGTPCVQLIQGDWETIMSCCAGYNPINQE